MPSSAKVIRLEPAESERAGALIARAFHEDPLTRHLLPDPATRARLTPGLFHAFVRYDSLFGHVDRLSDFRAVASWELPGAHGEDPERLAQADFDLLARAAPLAELEAVFAAINAALAAVVDEPHWHLRLLAVEPDAQGGGLGARVLQHGLDRADASGRPICLETFAQRALSFYLQNGFEVIVEGSEPVSDLPYWVLFRRPPR